MEDDGCWKEDRGGMRRTRAQGYRKLEGPKGKFKILNSAGPRGKGMGKVVRVTEEEAVQEVVDDEEGGVEQKKCESLAIPKMYLNPIIPSLFLNSIYPGGGKFAPPYKMPNNGREVPKLSWNLISYRD